MSDLLTIRRVEYFVAELPILLIPALLVSASPSALATSTFAEVALLFFMLFNVGDMANCLADRELDERHKPHLSRAVRALGTRSVAAQIVASAAAALALAVHLGIASSEPLIPLLVLLGLPLGAAYSLEPVRLKGRGVLHLITQWLIIFVGPMLLVAVVMGDRRPWLVALVAAAYGALQEASILVNCAEDHPEDRAAGVRTTIVALGLPRGMLLAARLAAAGGAALLAALAGIACARGAGASACAALALPLTAWIAVTAWLSALAISVRRAPSATALRMIRRHAKYVPIAVTVVAWSTALAVWRIVLQSAATG